MAPANESNDRYDDDQASTNYKEAFSLFDKRGTGRVALESLGDLLRACGQNPTLAEIKELEKSVGGDCKAGYFCYSACRDGMNERLMLIVAIAMLQLISSRSPRS